MSSRKLGRMATVVFDKGIAQDDLLARQVAQKRERDKVAAAASAPSANQLAPSAARPPTAGGAGGDYGGLITPNTLDAMRAMEAAEAAAAAKADDPGVEVEDNTEAPSAFDCLGGRSLFSRSMAAFFGYSPTPAYMLMLLAAVIAFTAYENITWASPSSFNTLVIFFFFHIAVLVFTFGLRFIWMCTLHLLAVENRVVPAINEILDPDIWIFIWSIASQAVWQSHTVQVFDSKGESTGYHRLKLLKERWSYQYIEDRHVRYIYLALVVQVFWAIRNILIEILMYRILLGFLTNFKKPVLKYLKDYSILRKLNAGWVKTSPANPDNEFAQIGEFVRKESAAVTGRLRRPGSIGGADTGAGKGAAAGSDGDLKMNSKEKAKERNLHVQITGKRVPAILEDSNINAVEQSSLANLLSVQWIRQNPMVLFVENERCELHSQRVAKIVARMLFEELLQFRLSLVQQENAAPPTSAGAGNPSGDQPGDEGPDAPNEGSGLKPRPSPMPAPTPGRDITSIRVQERQPTSVTGRIAKQLGIKNEFNADDNTDDDIKNPIPIMTKVKEQEIDMIKTRLQDGETVVRVKPSVEGGGDSGRFENEGAVSDGEGAAGGDRAMGTGPLRPRFGKRDLEARKRYATMAASTSLPLEMLPPVLRRQEPARRDGLTSPAHTSAANTLAEPALQGQGFNVDDAHLGGRRWGYVTPSKPSSPRQLAPPASSGQRGAGIEDPGSGEHRSGPQPSDVRTEERNPDSQRKLQKSVSHFKEPPSEGVDDQQDPPERSKILHDASKPSKSGSFHSEISYKWHKQMSDERRAGDRANAVADREIKSLKNVTAQDRDCLTRDFLALFMDARQLEDLMHMLDTQKLGMITEKSFVKGVMNVHHTRSQMISSLEAQAEIEGVFHRVASLFLTFLMLLSFLVVLGVSTNTIIISGGAVLSASGVVLSIIYTDFIMSIILVVFLNPYSIGDIMTIEGDFLIVKKITTYFTEFQSGNGHIVYHSHKMLYEKKLINQSRGANCGFGLDFYVSDAITFAQYDALIRVLKCYLSSRPLEFNPGAFVEVQEIRPYQHMKIFMFISCVDPWSASGGAFEAKNRFMQFVLRQCRLMGLMPSHLEQSIRLRDHEVGGTGGSGSNGQGTGSGSLGIYSGSGPAGVRIHSAEEAAALSMRDIKRLEEANAARSHR